MKKRKSADRWKATADVRELQQRRYLSQFAQWHYPWLVEIGRKWKERGDYAIDRFSLMDKYKDKDDIAVAGFVSLLTNDNARLADQITELWNLIGREPAGMVRKRDFIVLSRPEVSGERILGTNHFKGDLFNVLDYYWVRTNKYVKPLSALADVVKIQDFDYMCNMLEYRLTRTDGIGKGVWPDYGFELSCPVNKDMLRVIRAFYPKKGRYGLNVDAGNVDDVLQFMGFDDPTDFIYTYQGYCRMRELMPEAMARNELMFRKRYVDGWCMDEHGNHFKTLQRGLLPEIRFE